MTDLDKVKLIELYYTGTLSLTQQERFDQLIQADAQFKKDVKAYKRIFGGFRALQAERFQETLQRFERDHQAAAPAAPAKDTAPKGAVRSMRSWWYSAAAAVVLLLAATVAYQGLSPNLFEQNFAASSDIAVHISSTRAEDGLNEVEQIKKSAFQAYRNANYDQAIALLKDYRNNFPELFQLDYQAIVVLGVCQLAEGNAEKALSTFEGVISSRDSSYRQEAEWMIALAHLKLDDKDAARKELEKIAKQPDHIYYHRANDLLSEL